MNKNILIICLILSAFAWTFDKTNVFAEIKKCKVYEIRETSIHETCLTYAHDTLDVAVVLHEDDDAIHFVLVSFHEDGYPYLWSCVYGTTDMECYERKIFGDRDNDIIHAVPTSTYVFSNLLSDWLK